MKIIKYPQSCFMIETVGKKILIDPGNLSYEDKFLDEWKTADFVLITHYHPDHCYEEIIKQIDCSIYATQEVQSAYPNLKINTIKEKDIFNIGDVKVEVVKAVHGYIPWLKDRAEVHENVGFIVESENRRMYFTSDCICFKNEYKCDILLAPVSGHGLVMSPFEVSLFAEECGAKLVIPHHMDNPKFPVDIDAMKKTFEQYKVEYKLLKTSDRIEF